MESASEFHLGLIGWPLGHSLSPRLHSAALASAGLKGSYELFPVENSRSCGIPLKHLIQRIRAGELAGLNVTIPHKQHVLDLVDRLSPTAQAIGAVNTLFLRDGEVWGDNTDAPGFYLDLERQLSLPGESERRQALVLGAGGSARAVVYALASHGWQVTIAARRPDQADELIADLSGSGPGMRSCALQDVAAQVQADLIVNTTPVGMQPLVDNCPWPDGADLPAGACIYDLIYAPRQTRLTRTAQSAGLPAANGLGMLVEQAALAFEIWTGRPADRSAMRAAVEAI